MSKHPRKNEEKQKPFYLGSPSTPTFKKSTLPEVKPLIGLKKGKAASISNPSPKPEQINMEVDVKASYPESCKYDPDVKALKKGKAMSISNPAQKPEQKIGAVAKGRRNPLKDPSYEKFASEELDYDTGVNKADSLAIPFKSKYFSQAEQESMDEAYKLVEELAKIEIAEKEAEKAEAAKKKLIEKEKADKKGKVVGGILTWNDYFMSLCFLSAGRSKDPNTKVGACIVNEENKIIGMGYNGMPNGIADEELPWSKKDVDVLNTKYPYVCHAEMNAIMNKNTANLKGCIIYTTRYPCNECAKLIVQSGIVEVIYATDISVNSAANIAASYASSRILELSGVRVKEYKADCESIHLDFVSLTMTLK